MNYLLVKDTDLAEILPLRCQYMAELDLQLAVHSVGLCSLGSKQTQFINYFEPLPSPETEILVSRFIPEIDFASLQLIITHPRFKTIQPDQLLSQYHIPATPHVYKILEQSLTWPQSVLNWLVSKKIKPHEVAFLNLLSSIEIQSLLAKLCESSMSKSDALKALELASELIQMKTNIDLIMAAAWNEKIVSELVSLRFPLSTKQNPINQVQLKWPRSVSPQSKRIQDKMGFQIQFFVSHPDELSQTVNQLEKMIPDWAQKIEELNS